MLFLKLSSPTRVALSFIWRWPWIGQQSRRTCVSKHCTDQQYRKRCVSEVQNTSETQGCIWGRATVSQTVCVGGPKHKRNTRLHLGACSSIANGGVRTAKAQAKHLVAFAHAQQYIKRCMSSSKAQAKDKVASGSVQQYWKRSVSKLQSSSETLGHVCTQFAVRIKAGARTTTCTYGIRMGTWSMHGICVDYIRNPWINARYYVHPRVIQ